MIESWKILLGVGVICICISLGGNIRHAFMDNYDRMSLKLPIVSIVTGLLAILALLIAFWLYTGYKEEKKRVI